MEPFKEDTDALGSPPGSQALPEGPPPPECRHFFSGGILHFIFFTILSFTFILFLLKFLLYLMYNIICTGVHVMCTM